ncbi:MAG: nuclear transport factor 2 family protein [Sphingopyxis sp.]|uniref:nuclear transport factor 2 family protein n=1 Tax=Sphingopyxis sp. TaxID=1908224 RepID=UPI002AB8F5E7|nr:nuclear transport factor 2 family protein [Sphingopyxis sp.]MDZ3832251.1 nuclear transport factor 2 family protein [Sphingopyxis sp.]
MTATAFLAAAMAAAPIASLPMPQGADLRSDIAAADAQLFWAAFEGCDPAALPDLLAPDFRMIHDKGGLAVPSRDAMLNSVRHSCTDREAGGKHAGYRNRRLLVPGSRTIREMGEWGALEEAAHIFFEWRGAKEGWQMVGGARYMHLWQWMPAEGRFRLSQSYSYDHDAALPYPPSDPVKQDAPLK